MNGREVGLELTREWTCSLAYASMSGPWSIKVVNELYRCSKNAQDMLLNIGNGNQKNLKKPL